MKQLVGAALGLLLQWLRIDAIIAVKKARFASSLSTPSPPPRLAPFHEFFFFT